jgi:hypothetical protein
VPVEVTVHVPKKLLEVRVQSANVAAVISITAALVTSPVSRALLQSDVTPFGWLTIPKVPSSVCSERMGPQLDAVAVDGIADAHNVIVVAKSNTLFFENFFMSRCSL